MEEENHHTFTEPTDKVSVHAKTEHNSMINNNFIPSKNNKYAVNQSEGTSK